MDLTYHTATAADFDQLAELRIEAMRESLKAIGRFDRQRSVERFRATFNPELTKLIKRDDDLAGFTAVSPKGDHLYLDHLYIAPPFQSAGLGSWAIKKLIAVSESENLPIRLGALRSSRSNDFYVRHGFAVTHEDEFDIYYERKTTAV